MKTPRPATAINAETARHRHFPSLNAMFSKLGISPTYAAKKTNTCEPAKGWFLFDDIRLAMPETQRKLRKACPAFDKAKQAIEAKTKRRRKNGGDVAVRIDSRTIILVPAEKWTPDYADRYRAKMEASKPQPHSQPFKTFTDMNNAIKQKKVKRGPGRPRKGAA